MAMKFLRTRYEIADAINIKRYPVLTIDVRKPMDGYPDCYAGSKINVAGGHSKGHEDLLTRCTVKMFGDEPGNDCHDTPWMYKTIILSTGCTCLHNDFCLGDVLEDIEWSNARIVNAGDIVAVFFRSEHGAFLRLMKVSDRINPYCSTATTLVDID